MVPADLFWPKRSIFRAAKSDLYLNITRGAWLRNSELDYHIAQMVETTAQTGPDNARALGFTDDVSSSSTFLYGARRAVLIKRSTRL